MIKFIIIIKVNLIQAKVIWEEGTSVEKMPLADWPVSLLEQFLINS